jgi:hypothetical protein
MIPSARRAPRAAMSASVSWRKGYQFRMPTKTGGAGGACSRTAPRARAWAKVSSFSGERPPGIRS